MVLVRFHTVLAQGSSARVRGRLSARAAHSSVYNVCGSVESKVSMVDHACGLQVIHKELIMTVHKVTAYISPRCGAHIHTPARIQIMRNVDSMHINRLMGDDG